MDFRGALRDYVAIGGRTSMVLKQASGVWWSRWCVPQSPTYAPLGVQRPVVDPALFTCARAYVGAPAASSRACRYDINNADTRQIVADYESRDIPMSTYVIGAWRARARA